MHSNNPNTYIEQLLNNKPFTALSPMEKQAVLMQMTQQEYESLFLLTQKTQSHFRTEKELIPRPQTKASLHALLAKQKKRTHWFAKLEQVFSYQIPLYQPAIAALLLILVAYTLTPLSISKPKPHIVYITPTNDSTFSIVPVEDVDPVVVEKAEQYVERVQEKEDKSNPLRVITDSNLFALNVPDADSSQPIGRTLFEDSILAKFLIEAQ